MVKISDVVAQQLGSKSAVVALESTIFSNLGLPAPANAQAYRRCVDAINSASATPALTAVLDGVGRVGIEDHEAERICGPAKKMAARDVGVAIGQSWPYGASTVSASLKLASSAGVEVFATGGIGGVHRDVVATRDVSADLSAIAAHQMITVSAGAKVFLDLARTLEELETLSVPVLGWQCDEMPAFHAVSCGLPIPHRVETAAEVAAIARAHWNLGGGGILVVAPIPAADAMPLAPLENAIESALAKAADSGVRGAAVTPLLLAALAEATEGKTIPANLALAENNAKVAGQIAVELARV